MRGNVIDLAVGVIIGGTLNRIIASFVSDIIMPITGLLIGNIDLSERTLTLRNTGDKLLELRYGAFLGQIIDFLLMALVIFFMVKFINRLSNLRKKDDETPSERKCPFCDLKISQKACRCPHCTSHLCQESESDSEEEGKDVNSL